MNSLVISGTPGSGKTQLALLTAYNKVAVGEPTLVISVEHDVRSAEALMRHVVADNDYVTEEGNPYRFVHLATSDVADIPTIVSKADAFFKSEWGFPMRNVVVDGANFFVERGSIPYTEALANTTKRIREAIRQGIGREDITVILTVQSNRESMVA